MTSYHILTSTITVPFTFPDSNHNHCKQPLLDFGRLLQQQQSRLNSYVNDDDDGVDVGFKKPALNLISNHVEDDVKTAEETANHQPIEKAKPHQSYGFGYNVDDGYGNKQWRHEKSSKPNEVTGSYGYKDKNGIMREVEYIADRYGFRAFIKTNEPGTASNDPAFVRIDSNSHAIDYPQASASGPEQQANAVESSSPSSSPLSVSNDENELIPDYQQIIGQRQPIRLSLALKEHSSELNSIENRPESQTLFAITRSKLSSPPTSPILLRSIDPSILEPSQKQQQLPSQTLLNRNGIFLQKPLLNDGAEKNEKIKI
ncbi:cuticle protein-like protein 7 [Sarcoptes scabiei]|uniref:Cuticle protein-like protein 7 n=1 Tax=Sarcoptes scabiei TaxID=52283 RepID=A0A132AMZ3_SARSC|nr:cuticle protein-like protein 7 [Sarcoptes scabiei]